MVTDSHSRVLGTTIIHNIHNPIIQDTRSSATGHPPITSGPSSVPTRLHPLDPPILILQHKISTACSTRTINRGSMAGLMGLVGEGCRRCITSSTKITTNLSICNTIRTYNRIIPHTQPMVRYLVTMRTTHQESFRIQHRTLHPVISRMVTQRQHAEGRRNR